MIWQFHFWLYTQKNWKQSLEKMLVDPCYRSIIHNSQKVEANQVSTGGWMDKQNVVYTYNGILFSLQKEGNCDLSYNMDEAWGHYAKWNKPVRKGQTLYDFTSVRCLK